MTDVPSAFSRVPVIVACMILVLCLLMTMKYFPGLENEPAYAGIAYQTIYPDAFQNDTYRSPDLSASSKIVQHSLIYGLTKIVGPLWLDDRFLACLYAVIVGIGLLGIDRTAQLLGATGLYERLAILLVFAKDHAILDHKVLLAHHQDFNHNTFAIPIIVWLFYAALARKGLFIVLAISLLLLAVSIRNAPIPILSALAVVFVTGHRWEKVTIAGLSVLGLAASYWILFHFFSINIADRLELWAILKAAAGGDVNPWDEASYNFPRFAIINSIWFAIIFAAAWVAKKREGPYQGVFVLMMAASATWVLGGAYISFAPDALKQPLLQGIAPTRALAWPQNVAYIALFATGFAALRADTAGRLRRFGVAIGLIGLFIIGPGNIGLWTGLVAAGIAGSVAILFYRAQWMIGRLPGAFTSYPALAATLMLSIVSVVAYTNAAVSKAPAWTTAWQTGVFGDGAPAVWIGVNEYIREHTPADAVILPISFRHDIASPADILRAPSTSNALSIRRTLGTRTGRAMPVPEDFPGNFRDPDAWRAGEEQKAVIDGIKELLSAGKICAAFDRIQKLAPQPDYVVIPATLLPDENGSIGHYHRTANVRYYAILQFNEEAESLCPQP